MDTLISITSLIQRSSTMDFEKGETIALTAENPGTTLFSAKEFHSLKIQLDVSGSNMVEKVIMQTYKEDMCEISLSDKTMNGTEVLLNDCREEISLVPGLYYIEVHLNDSNIYGYYYEILGQHTEENALKSLRDNVNDYAHGLAVNPSVSGQSIATVLDETDHLIELLKKRWVTVKGQIELIQRNPVSTLFKTHILRNELVKEDPHVIRYRDKHIGSRKVLQPRISSHYDNADNHALLKGLEVFHEQIHDLMKRIYEKEESCINTLTRLNEKRDTQLQDKIKLEKYHFDSFEILTANIILYYTRRLINQEINQLKHLRKQMEELKRLSREVTQTKSLLEYKWGISTNSNDRGRTVTNVLYRNCIENMTESQDLKALEVIEPHSGFNYKASETLFEYLGLLKTFELLFDLGYSAGEELKNVIQSYTIPSGSEFHFTKDKQLIKVLYDKEALSLYDATYEGLVSENSINRRPDIVVEYFLGGKILGIIIIEAKYRKVSYLHSDIKDAEQKYRRTEVEQTMSDYRSLKYYMPDKKEKDVDAVVVYYPKQEKNVPDNWGKDFAILKKYGHFVPVDIASPFGIKDEFYYLINNLLMKVVEEE